MDRSAASDTMAVILLIVGFISFLQRFYGGKKIDLNNIEIFREYPIHSQTYSHPVTYNYSSRSTNTKNKVRTSTRTKVTPKPKTQTVKNTNDEFKQDCLKALMSLGSKKKEAKIIVDQIFSKYNPTTIQEFIQIAYTKS